MDLDEFAGLLRLQLLLKLRRPAEELLGGKGLAILVFGDAGITHAAWVNSELLIHLGTIA